MTTGHIATRRLSVFEQISVDGFFADERGDMSWAHRADPEWTQWTEENTRSDAVLLFGRVTYELMARFWPTELAVRTAPVIAAQMNARPKVVFSRTLTSAAWENTTLVREDAVEAVRAMKREAGPDLVVLGSGSLVAQLTEARLVDRYTIVVCPIVLGRGRALFAGLSDRAPLTLAASRAFGNGNVVLTYASA